MRILLFFLVCLMPILHSLQAHPLSIKDYLATSKEKYLQSLDSTENPLEKIHFVMGNESADLDSIVSAIAYAHLLDFENRSHPHQLYLPLLNLHREEFFLRKDSLYLFQLLNVSSEDLLFLDDVPLHTLLSTDKLRMTLVDHNILNPRQEFLSVAIERIIDHHKDEGTLYPLLPSENKLIAVVGSTSTLIAEKLFANKSFLIDSQLALFLLAPILVDTSNLQSPEKTTLRDLLAAETLCSLAVEILPADFYNKLFAAKHDVTGLTPEMLLRKDFKEYLDGNLLYGISSFPTTVRWGEEDIPLISPILEEYAKDRKLSLLFVMMTEMDEQIPRRRILVYSHSSKLLTAFYTYVNSDDLLSQVFSPAPSSQDKRIHFYVGERWIARKELQTLFNFSQSHELMRVFKHEIKALSKV